MWIPNVLFDALLTLGPHLERLDRALDSVVGHIHVLTRIETVVTRLQANAEQAAASAELVAFKVAEELRVVTVDRDALNRLDGENQALRARVVQQETTIKSLLTQLELSGARESTIFAHLGVVMRLPVQQFVAGAPTTHPIAPAGVTDAHGVPVSTPADVDTTLKVLASTIRDTQGGSAAPPTAVGQPGDLPDDLFADLGELGGADAGAVTVPPSV